MVELMTALAFSIGYWFLLKQGIDPVGSWANRQDIFLILNMIKIFVFSAFLIIIFVYDLKHYLILDTVTVPAMIFAILINILLDPSLATLQGLGIAALVGGGF